MTSWDDIWSGTALTQYEALSFDARRQVEATVRQICAEPGGVGIVVPGETLRPRPLHAARAGSVLVLYELDAIGEMVHVLRFVDRG